MPDIKGLPYPNASAIPDGPGAFLALNSVLSQGRGFRRFATWTAMDAVGDAVTNELAIVDAVPGAWFKYDGADWVMNGTARFADATARDAALPSPGAGWLAFTTATGITYRYSGTAWVSLFNWTAPTLAPGITNISGGQPTQYAKLNDTVFFNIGVDGSSGSAYVLFTLPAGFRPIGTIRFWAATGGFIEITSNGQVSSSLTGTKTGIYASGSFRAA